MHATHKRKLHSTGQGLMELSNDLLKIHKKDAKSWWSSQKNGELDIKFEVIWSFLLSLIIYYQFIGVIKL